MGGLIIVTLASIEILNLLGVRDALSIVVLAVAGASHATARLLNIRRFGIAVARPADGYAAIAVPSFTVVSLLQSARSPLAILQPTLPMATWYLGIALAVALSLSPGRCVAPDVEQHTPRSAYSCRSLLLILSLLLIVGSAGGQS